MDLLCDIQDAISTVNKKVLKLPKYSHSIKIFAHILARGEQADSVTGVEITDSAKNIEFKLGTRIQAKGKDVGKVTGLKIDKNDNSSKEDLK